MTDIFFSILIPVFNTESFLEKCLDSINFEKSGIEIIAVNDASTDSSLSILRKKAENDPRLKILCHGTNYGLLQARRSAVAEAKGKYVLFLDSDDFFADGALDKLYERLSAAPADILEFGYQIIPLGTKILPVGGSMNSNERIKALLRRNCHYMPTIWNKVYSGALIRRAYAKIEGFYANTAEDFYQSLVIASYADSFDAVKECLYVYRYGPGCSTNGGLDIKQIAKILVSMRAVLDASKRFLEAERPEMYSDLIGAEKRFLDETIRDYIMIMTREECKDQALLLLPRFFDEKLLEEHLRNMRTKFDRMTTGNDFFAAAKKLDNAVNEFFPCGTFRRKTLNSIYGTIKNIFLIPFRAFRKIYRFFRPHESDVRKELLKKSDSDFL